MSIRLKIFKSVFILGFYFMMPAHANSDGVVLLPIELSPEIQGKRSVIEDAIVQSMAGAFQVLAGDTVNKAVKKISLNHDCRFVACPGLVAESFEVKLMADASLQKIEDALVFSIRIENAETGRVFSAKQAECNECSISYLLETIKAETKSAAENAKNNLANGGYRDVNRNQKTNREEKSSSFLKYGIGGLALAALGGGGGGGSSSSDSQGNSEDDGPPYESDASLWTPKLSSTTWQSNDNLSANSPAKRVTLTLSESQKSNDSRPVIDGRWDENGEMVDVGYGGYGKNYDFEYQFRDDGTLVLANISGNRDSHFDLALGDIVGEEIVNYRSGKLFRSLYAETRGDDEFDDAGTYPAHSRTIIARWLGQYTQYFIELNMFEQHYNAYAGTSGLRTEGVNIPVAGTATFNGFSEGIYESWENLYHVSHRVRFDVDWNDMDNTTYSFTDAAVVTHDNLVDGPNVYAELEDINQFNFLQFSSDVGWLFPENSPFSGVPEVNFAFFGPNAEELAGTFYTIEDESGADPGYSLVGSFGAAR